MDTFALGLIKASKIIEDGRIDEFVEKRYSSYESGIGEKILKEEISFEELEEYVLDKKDFNIESGSQEYLESIINSILFN